MSQEECTLCGPGTYASGKGSEECVPCPIGRYSGADPGATQCNECSAGKSANAASQNCVQCAAGTSAGPGSQSCTTCAPPSYSAEGSSTCLYCDTGKYNLDNTCVDCSPGYVRADKMAFNAPTYSLCEPCAADSYSTNGLTCTPCEDGKKSTLGSAECNVQCDASQFTYKNNDNQCACKPGFEFNSAGGCTSMTDASSCQTGTICKQCSQDFFSSDFSTVRNTARCTYTIILRI